MKRMKHLALWLSSAALVLNIAGCSDRPGITNTPVTAPQVSSTDPANAATGVAFNQKISATFDVAMDPSTVTSATYTVRQGTTSVAGFVSFSGTTAIFEPASDLAPNTSYTATVSTGVTDLAGNALASNYIWNFTTSAAAVVIAPLVSSTDPAHGATGVAVNHKIAATFSKTMDPATLTTASFMLKRGTESVAGFVSYSDTTAVFSPAVNLLPNTLYTATITTGAKDLAGNGLANDKVWSFATTTLNVPTVSATDPVNRASGVALNKAFAAQFSKKMDASTITASTFIVMRGTTPVSGFVSYSDSTATFTPSSSLWSNAAYTATITTGARDLSGNALADNYVWSCTTAASPAGLPISLGSAGNFAALSGAGITNTGVTTHVYGDVGSFPTATIAGLLPANVTGTLYTVADPLVGAAINDLTTAYNEAQARSLGAVSLPGNLGGLTLAPALYVNSSTSGISGTGANAILTLDAGGDVNAIWVFKMGSTFITDPGTSIVLAGGAQWKNIFWSVGTSATLGTTSVFYGNILADQAITINTGAVLHGRALARISALTLDACIVDKR